MSALHAHVLRGRLTGCGERRASGVVVSRGRRYHEVSSILIRFNLDETRCRGARQYGATVPTRSQQVEVGNSVRVLRSSRQPLRQAGVQ